MWKSGVAAALAAGLVLGSGMLSAKSGAANDAVTAASGTLVVQSEPAGANVYVDGRLAGLTPLQLERLTPGDHRVRLVKDGYVENARIVSVGTTSKSVRVTLTPQSGTRNAASEQVTGPGGGGSRRWLWIAAAGGGAAAAAVVIATRNHPPVAGSVVASPTGGLAASTAITFTAQGASDPDGDALTYTWDFGDNSSGSGASVSHTYATAGTFNVTVTVSDGKKSATASGSVTIRSMTGAWTGNIAGTLPFAVNLNQSGATITGTYSDRDGAGVLSAGTVLAGSIVRFTVTQPGFLPFIMQGTANAGVNSVTGTVVSGFVGTPSFTMTR
jgi:PKD repeat protein